MKHRSQSPEERILADQEFNQAVDGMLNHIRSDHSKRPETIRDILLKIQATAEPEKTDQMDILKAAIKKGHFTDDLATAVDMIQYPSRREREKNIRSWPR